MLSPGATGPTQANQCTVKPRIAKMAPVRRSGRWPSVVTCSFGGSIAVQGMSVRFPFLRATGESPPSWVPVVVQLGSGRTRSEVVGDVCLLVVDFVDGGVCGYAQLWITPNERAGLGEELAVAVQGDRVMRLHR